MERSGGLCALCGGSRVSEWRGGGNEPAQSADSTSAAMEGREESRILERGGLFHHSKEMMFKAKKKSVKMEGLKALEWKWERLGRNYLRRGS